ncbi:MAG: type III polyketide synthase [Chloroflexi bacterium]|nr:MAG: type III polyketide synthase [Chloroflexota bacterium]
MFDISNNPRIVSVASCFPPYYYSQQELTNALIERLPLSPQKAARLKQFHENVEVQGRYLALPREEYDNLSGFAARNDAWIDSALKLGQDTLATVMEKGQISPKDVSLLATTTITGIAVPSLEARLMNKITFPKDMKRMPFFGYGCLGGAAGIARLADYLVGHPTETALLLAIELCSLTIQHDDTSVANLVASGLFGDGAAAVLLAGSEHPLAQQNNPKIIATRSVFFPDSEHIMGWDVKDTGFKVVLSADVSEVAGSLLVPELETFLGERNLNLTDIQHWIVHPGGPKVIHAVEESLKLKPDALQISRESLSRVGNISSASVLLILEETLARFHPDPGTYGVLMAMGPAFSAELVLLQWLAEKSLWLPSPSWRCSASWSFR